MFCRTLHVKRTAGSIRVKNSYGRMDLAAFQASNGDSVPSSRFLAVALKPCKKPLSNFSYIAEIVSARLVFGISTSFQIGTRCTALRPVRSTKCQTLISTRRGHRLGMMCASNCKDGQQVQPYAHPAFNVVRRGAYSIRKENGDHARSKIKIQGSAYPATLDGDIV